MANTTHKRTIGQRVNNWLAEPEGQQFVAGKWRFWLVAVVGLSSLNAILTALVFQNDDKQWNYTGAIMLSVGALLAWIAIGCLHYSDSTDRKLAQGVSAMDSVTLLFVTAHFCGLLWVYGHLRTLQSAEAKYLAAAEKYNVEARQIQSDNAKIADSLRQVAAEETKRARIENDSIYQARKAAQAGVKIAPRQSHAAGASLSTSPVELAKPPEAPKDSAADYLTRWDAAIRLANFGELILAALTLIFIRNRSAKTNTPGVMRRGDEIFPDEIDAGVIGKRSPSRRQNLTTLAGKDTRVLAEKKDTAKTYMSFDLARAEAGLTKLREALKDISFRLAGVSFKADPNPNLKECRKSGLAPDHIWIRAMRANQGTQETIHSAKAKLDILTDATTMERSAFRERLERFLRSNGFNV